MKAASFLGMLCAVAGVSLCLNVQAQTLLSVDFNQRAANTVANTQPGFDTFVIGNVGGNIIQTGTVTRTIGAYTVSVTGVGSNPGVDDRSRTAPVDGGNFTQGRLLRDFIFSRETAGTAGGLDILAAGFAANTEYVLTIWSYDTSSLTPSRYSDWSANGTSITNGYAFGAAPTNDTQYQFTAHVTSDGSGQIAISGRRNDTTPNQFAVFINALQISTPAQVPPVILTQPADVEEYENDAVMLGVAVSGSQPFSYQWFRADAVDPTPIPGATLASFVITNLSASDVGRYLVIITNSVGSATSSVAQVTMRPIESLMTGLISYWPLDALPSTTPDITTNNSALFPHGIDASYLVPGKYSNAVSFNPETGIPAYLSLELTNSPALPIYQYPSHTVAAWVNGNAPALTQNDRRIYCEASTNSPTPLWSIGTDSAATPTGVVDIFIRNDGNASTLNHRKTSLIAFDGTWHHIAWVDNNGIGAVYVDGVKDTNDFTYPRAPLTSTVVALGIVQRTNLAAAYTGLIDDVATWRRALRADEIVTMMTNSLPAMRIVEVLLAEGSVTLTYTVPVLNQNPRVQQLSTVGGMWTDVEGVSYSPYTETTYRAQFAAPPGEQRFYRLAY